MGQDRRFRFAAGGFAETSGTAWADRARRVEAQGYATLAVNDHLGAHGSPLAPIVALAAAASATTTLRLGSMVFNNGLKHPAILAREAASIDVLSGGRLEFGVGAGNYPTDAAALGLPFDPASVRITRLAEAIQIITGLWGAEEFSFSGQHYSVDRLSGIPAPAQQPRPPLLLGGGTRRMLELAAQEADIVSVPPGRTAASFTGASLARKLALIQEVAGDRFDDLEVHTLLPICVVTSDRRAASEAILARAGSAIGFRDSQEILDSPCTAIGSPAEIGAKLRWVRETYRISYFTVWGGSADAFAPVVAELAGT